MQKIVGAHHAPYDDTRHAAQTREQLIAEAQILKEEPMSNHPRHPGYPGRTPSHPGAMPRTSHPGVVDNGYPGTTPGDERPYHADFPRCTDWPGR